MIALKTVGFLFAAFLLFHWMTAGQSTIQEGPPDQLFPHSTTK